MLRRSPRFDDGFEDDLTDLDIEIAQNPDLNMIRLSVLALPPASEEAIASFLDRGNALVYAHVE